MRFKNKVTPSPYKEWVLKKAPVLIPRDCHQCKDILWLETLYYRHTGHDSTLYCCRACRIMTTLKMKGEKEYTDASSLP